MSRLQRLAFVTAFLALLPLLIGGLLRATGTELACSGVWPWCGLRWSLETGPSSIAGTLYGLATAIATLLTLLTAALTRRPPASVRSRRIAWLAAGVQVGSFVTRQFAVNASSPAALLAAASVLAMMGLALAFLLCWSLASDRGAPVWGEVSSRLNVYPRDDVLVWMSRIGVAALLTVIGSGAVTAVMPVELPCASWPLCVDGSLLPDQPTTTVWLHMAHRLLTVVAAVSLIAMAYRVWSQPSPRLIRQLTLLMLAVLVVQILLGGNLVVAGGPVWLDMLHLLAGIVLWLVVISFAVLTPMMSAAPNRAPAVVIGSGTHGRPTVPSPTVAVATSASAALALPSLAAPLPVVLPDPRALRVIIADYVALMKPGILSLLLVTTFAAMLIATAGLPPFGLLCITIAGGVLVSGGANVLNCYIDRDIDARMARTQHRATASNRIPPSQVLVVGVSLTASAVLLLGIGANWVAALLALAGNLYYVLIYTAWLKRRTPHNVVIGGAAGAVPPLVGWAAVTGDLSPVAWMLFAIIFMWTPPHSWALALLKQGEYGRAEVPMLPVVAGEAETRRQIVIYTVLLVLVCLALVPLGLGSIYFVAALLINAVFLGLALQLYWRPSKRHARRLFFGSLWYLALIFLAAVVDRLILG